MDPIDRELASLLSVEPSPEFRARVRERIALEPAPRSWYLQWRVAAAAAAALSVAVAVVVIALVVGRPGGADSLRRANPVAVDPPRPPALAAAEPRATVTPHTPDRAVRRRAPRVNDVQVLVAPDEVRAFRQLAAIVQRGRAQFVFADEHESVAVQEPIWDIVVAPIAVAPLEVATNQEPAVDAEGDQQ